MKFFLSILITGLVSFAACLYLPWWVIAIASFLVAALIPQRPMLSFLSGFIALFALWFGLSFYISAANHDVFAHRISLLILKADSPVILMLVTGVIGGLVGGFGALTGSFLKRTGEPVNNS